MSKESPLLCICWYGYWAKVMTTKSILLRHRKGTSLCTEWRGLMSPNFEIEFIMRPILVEKSLQVSTIMYAVEIHGKRSLEDIYHSESSDTPPPRGRKRSFSPITPDSMIHGESIRFLYFTFCARKNEKFVAFRIFSFQTLEKYVWNSRTSFEKGSLSRRATEKAPDTEEFCRKYQPISSTLWRPRL